MKPRTLLIVIVLIALLAAAAWIGLRRSEGRMPKAAPPSLSATPEAPLEFAPADVLVLAPGSVARSIPITGTLKPNQQSLVRAKVAGELRDLLVREGVSVTAGQVLARIDPTEFEWRVKEREAQLRGAQAQLDQAQRTLENNQRLFEKGFISQSALDAARSGSDVAIGARDAADAQLTVARKALADTGVIAPLSGVVAERFVQPGEKVSPDNRIFTIVDLSRMEIEALVPAAEVSKVRVGQTVTLQVEGVDAAQTGQVVRISPATSAGTRSVAVYLSLENRGASLRAGLFAQGALALESHTGVIVVPAAAVREAAGRSFVYAIDNGVLVEKAITTGLRDDAARADNGGTGVIEVTQGLKAGDRIVGVNLGVLRNGSAVQVREKPAAPGGKAGSVQPAAKATPATR